MARCQMLYENQEAPNQPIGDDPLHIVAMSTTTVISCVSEERSCLNPYW